MFVFWEIAVCWSSAPVCGNFRRWLGYCPPSRDHLTGKPARAWTGKWIPGLATTPAPSRSADPHQLLVYELVRAELLLRAGSLDDVERGSTLSAPARYAGARGARIIGYMVTWCDPRAGGCVFGSRQRVSVVRGPATAASGGWEVVRRAICLRSRSSRPRPSRARTSSGLPARGIPLPRWCSSAGCGGADRVLPLPPPLRWPASSGWTPPRGTLGCGSFASATGSPRPLAEHWNSVRCW